MNILLTYGIIFVILLVLELAYFKVADKFNIIDKPNERSSHSTIVLRGGGIIFLIGAWVWAIAMLISDEGLMISDCYPFFLIGLTLVAGVSFVDDIRSLPDKWRLLAQFTAMSPRLGSFVLQPINKMFATYYYDPEMSKMDFDYQLVSFEESLKRVAESLRK